MKLVEVMSQGQINMHNFLGLLVHSVFLDLLILSVYMMAEIQFYYCLTQSFIFFLFQTWIMKFQKMWLVISVSCSTSVSLVG